MNGIQAFMSEPWVTRLGWTLLHFLWQGTAIAVLYTIARFLFARSARAQTRYSLACAALVAMATAPPLTFLTISTATVAPTRMAPTEMTSWTLSATQWKWLLPVVVGFWVAGVFAFSMRLFGAFRFTHRLRATSHPVPPEWQQTLEQIAARMGRSFFEGKRQVRLMGSSMVNSPAVIGYLRPVILVPVAFLTGLPAEHIVALLAHEMAHIRRNDYLASILQSIAEVVLFYHPAVWWISEQIRAEREACCDDLAIAAGTDVLTYARALTEMESRRPARLQPELAANGGSLVDRIRRLIEPAYIGAHYLPGKGTAGTMLLLWLVGAGVAAIPAAQKTIASPPANLAATVLPQRPDNIPASSGPANSPLDSLVGQARKTLLFDPVFSAQLTQPPVQVAQMTVTLPPAPRLVVEDVTVKNSGGRIIEGLGKEDFAVTEDGNQRDISFFDFENVERSAATSAPAPATAVVALPALAHTQIAPESRGQLRYKDRRLIALYFDMTSMSVTDRLRALEAAQRFVGAQMSAADVLCLMQYKGAGVEVLQDFTGDRDRLVSVIATMAVGAADAPPDAGGSSPEADSEFTWFSADRNMAALRTAEKMLASLNEKKSLIYFSDGLNLSATDNQAPLRGATLDAIRAGISIFPIDARGAAVRGAEVRGGAEPSDALSSLGADTGGKAMADSADLATGIVAAEKSITSYYIVGYSAANEALDGRFRRVTIAMNNNADAKLEYRRGYFAEKDFGTVAEPQGKERQLEDAMMMGDTVSDLTLAAEVNYFRQNNAESFTPVTLKIPGSELALARKSGAERTVIDFIGEIQDERGMTVQNIRGSRDIRLTDATAQEWAKRPIAYDTGFNLLPGVYTIKILARDSETARIGTFLSRFTIPNLNREDQQLPITSVVLGTQLDDAPVNPSVVNPLVQDGKRLMPSVTRVFSSKNDMYVYLQAFEKGATTAKPLMAHATFYKGAVKVMETPPITVSDGLDPKSKMLPIRLDVPLASLKPGEYDCQVTVLDPATQKSALWQKPVMIVQ